MRYFVFTLLAVFSQVAQAAEQEAFVKTDEASLLAGPGNGMPEAARIRKNTKLRIHHEEGDYYAVQPPAGSVSWIRMSYLQFVRQPNATTEPSIFPAQAVVDANGLAKLKSGRVGEAKPLSVERVAIPDGSILTVVGQKVDVDGMKWYPIAAPEDDFRYILKSAVELGSAVESKFVVNSPNNGVINNSIQPASGTNAISSVAVPSGGNWNHPSWIEAQRAERAGEWDRAEKTYLELAKEMNKPGGTEKLAEDCYARVHDIREKRRKALGRTSSAIPSSSEINRREVGTSTGNITQVKNEVPAEDAARWEGPGTLYLSALRLNGEKLYALQSNPRSVITYAKAGTGIDLSRYTNQTVRLFGTVSPLTGYPGNTVMLVTKVELSK